MGLLGLTAGALWRNFRGCFASPSLFSGVVLEHSSLVGQISRCFSTPPYFHRRMRSRKNQPLRLWMHCMVRCSRRSVSCSMFTKVHVVGVTAPCGLSSTVLVDDLIDL